VWKYRFFLTSQKKALTKFLKCVQWDAEKEEKQALDLLDKWIPVDVDDALELLSSNFKHSTVRRYGVARLKQASDEDLVLYLLQLVQALKYENPKDIVRDFDPSTDSRNKDIDSSVTLTIEPQLRQRKTAASNAKPEVRVANQESKETSSLLRDDGSDNDEDDESPLQSHNVVNMEVSMAEAMSDLTDNSTEDRTLTVPVTAPSKDRAGTQLTVSSNMASSLESSNSQDEKQQDSLVKSDAPIDLATFLIHRACNNFVLASNLYWYLMVECEDDGSTTVNSSTIGAPSHKDMYSAVIRQLLTELRFMGSKGIEFRELLSRQEKFVDDLVKLVKAVASEKADRPKKIESLKAMLFESKEFDFGRIGGLPLPLDPSVRIVSVISQKAYVFKSALQPCKLVFKTVGGPGPGDNSLPGTGFGEYMVIFKNGDDLRQDQLVLQIIQLMDNLLRRENLDLKLTPYKALASSSRHGFVQFVPSTTVGAVLKEHSNSILNFFRTHAPDSEAPLGVAPEVMDNYVKSCAGYCIITYILGVGDRHNDNLVLTTTGKLFHVDFGFILGRDPKPLPPPMKLSKEMVEAMGGYNSELFQTFKKHCYAAFLHLRRNANLILNLFSLMLDANIPDIALEPDKTVKKVHDKFRLDLSDEEAIQYLHFIIESSIKAFFPVMMERFHTLAAYFKA